MAMRSLFLFPFTLVFVAVGSAGCGGDSGGTTTPPVVDSSPSETSDTSVKDSTPGDSTPTDSGADTTTTDSGGGDTGSSGDSGITCGTLTCTGGDICCATPRDGGVDFACAKTCSDGGVPITCDGPEDCSSSAKYCCGTLDVGAGSPPACPLKAAGASCKATCDTSIPFSCPGKGQVKLCHKKSDCADDTANPNCCTFSSGGGTATFCANDTIAAFGTCI